MAWWTGQPVYGSNPVSKFVRENFAYLKQYVDYIVNSGVTTADLAAVHASPPTLAAVVNITVNTTIGDTDVGLGGGYNISPGIVLTIDGAFSAPRDQIFFGTGTVDFAAGSVTEIYPEWWGTGGADDSAALQSAFNQGGLIKLSGSYTFATSLTVPNGITIDGGDRTTTVLTYTGIGDGFINTNPVNTSGYARVTFKNFSLIGNNTTNIGAGIDLLAGGWSYYEICTVRIMGFKYQIICDQTEITHIHHSLIETGVINGIGIWITSGAEWRPLSAPNFSNVITINDNQLNGGAYGLRDDGGLNHHITGNNFNGHTTPMWCCGVTGLHITGNNFESAVITGYGNLVLSNTAAYGGAVKTPNTNGVIMSNAFQGDIPGGSLLITDGDYHTGFQVSGNYFGSQWGRGAAINVDKFKNCHIGPNYDFGNNSMFHYTGQHRNEQGNILYPPQYGSSVLDNDYPYEFGDTARPVNFYGGIQIGNGTVIMESTGGAALGITDGGDHIAHGMSTTPTWVILTPTVAGEIVTATALDANFITVYIKKHDGTPGTAQTIYWQAFR